MADVMDLSTGFSVGLAQYLLGQVSEKTPEIIIQALGKILTEKGFDYINAKSLEITRTISVDERSKEHPQFSVSFATTFSTECNPAFLGADGVISELRARHEFNARVQHESVQGSLRVPVRPPEKIVIIQNHFEMQEDWERHPHLHFSCYKRFYCLPDEAATMLTNLVFHE